MIIFTGISVFLLPGFVHAATVYVSQDTSNGYSIGDDAYSYTQSQSKATPKLTLRGAAAVVQDGDTIIINDGTYAEYDYVVFNDPNITVNAENDYLAIIQNATSSAARIIHQASQASNLTLGKIVLDGNNDEKYCYTSDSGTNTNGLTINGTKCLNPTTGFIYGLSRLYNLTMMNNWTLEMSNTSDLSCIYLNPPVAGAISIKDGTITISSTTDASSKCIQILPTVAGVPITISGVSITQTGDGTNSVKGIYLKGGSTYNIYNNVINTSNANPPSGIEIHNSDTLTTSDANIYNNSGTLNTSSGGYLVLVGDDGTPTTANTISGIDVYNNNFTGANHGYLIGHVTGANVYNNIANDVSIGFIGKETVSTKFYNNIVNNVTSASGGLRSKGATNDVFYNNTVYIPTGSTATAMYISSNSETATDSTGIILKNNLIKSVGANVFSNISSSNTASFSNDLYYSQSGSTSNSWWNQSAWYSVFSDWQTAKEITAQYAAPLFASSTPYLATGFQLQQFSPAIDSGTGVSLSTDYAGNPIYGKPDIGAYEYQPPYTIGTNSVPITGSTRIYSDGKYRMRTASSTSAVASFTVTPPGGNYLATTTQYMDITIDSWQTTGDKNKQWTATSTAGDFLTHATTTVYTVGDLLPNTYYQFKIDGTASTTAVIGTACNSNGACLSDSNGQVVFNYTGGYSTHTFALEKDTTGPNSFSLAIADNTKTSNTKPTLAWSATIDSSSSLSKYQLYIDGSLDTDNISSSATSATPTNALNCGNHTWYVKAVDSQGNGTNSSTRTITMACGGGIFTGPASSLPGYVKPRLQTIYSDGTIIYHDKDKTDKKELTIDTNIQNEKITTQEEIDLVSLRKNIRTQIATLQGKLILVLSELVEKLQTKLQNIT